MEVILISFMMHLRQSYSVWLGITIHQQGMRYLQLCIVTNQKDGGRHCDRWRGQDTLCNSGVIFHRLNLQKCEMRLIRAKIPLSFPFHFRIGFGVRIGLGLQLSPKVRSKLGLKPVSSALNFKLSSLLKMVRIGRKLTKKAAWDFR